MADGLTLDVNLSELSRMAAGLALEVQLVVGAALYEQMLDVMDEAKGLCPVDSGELRDSGTVERVQVSGGQVSVELNFGVHPHLDYAAEQHENLTLHHAPGKQAKFLEVPLTKWASRGGPASVVRDVELYLGRAIR